jgi:hypothetical protein
MRDVRTRVPPAAAKGEVPVIRAGEGDGCLTTACGTVSTTYGGGLRSFAHLKAPLIESLSDEESLRAQFQLVLAELAAPTGGTRTMTESLLKQCLIALLRRHIKTDSGPPRLDSLNDGRLAQAISAMLERPAAAFTLEDLAGMPG